MRQEKPWKGTTIFKVKPGGFKRRRTNVRASISVGNRSGDVDEDIYVPDSVHEPSSSSRKPPAGGSSNLLKKITAFRKELLAILRFSRLTVSQHGSVSVWAKNSLA